jgi:general secretion pathway protein J
MMAPERPAGFTLLELIVSLTILGVIVTIVYGAMNVGVRAWEKGERDVEGRQRYRIVLDRIGQQLASTVVPVETAPADAARHLLKGDGDAVEFVSRISLDPENRSGPVDVKYEVQTIGDGARSLVCHEQILARRSPDATEPEAEGEEVFVLFPRVAECRFEYFRASHPEDAGKRMAWKMDPVPEVIRGVDPLDIGAPGDRVYSWEASWEADVEKQNPRAVGLYLRMDGESEPLRIVVPLPGGDGP